MIYTVSEHQYEDMSNKDLIDSIIDNAKTISNSEKELTEMTFREDLILLCDMLGHIVKHCM